MCFYKKKMTLTKMPILILGLLLIDLVKSDESFVLRIKLDFDSHKKGESHNPIIYNGKPKISFSYFRQLSDIKPLVEFKSNDLELPASSTLDNKLKTDYQVIYPFDNLEVSGWNFEGANFKLIPIHFREKFEAAIEAIFKSYQSSRTIQNFLSKLNKPKNTEFQQSNHQANFDYYGQGIDFNNYYRHNNYAPYGRHEKISQPQIQTVSDSESRYFDRDNHYDHDVHLRVQSDHFVPRLHR